jgi:hypothetical protein
MEKKMSNEYIDKVFTEHGLSLDKITDLIVEFAHKELTFVEPKARVTLAMDAIKANLEANY